MSKQDNSPMHLAEPHTNGATPPADSEPTPIRPVSDLSAQEKRALIEAHREKKESVQERKDKGRVEGYVALTGAPIGGVPRPAKCTIEGFEHLTAYYLTGKPMRKRKEQPLLDMRLEGESDDEYYARYDAWAVKMADWIPLFVARIDGWNLRYSDDTPVPNPVNDPSIYTELFHENEPLAVWIAYTGYKESLENAVGESGAV